MGRTNVIKILSANHMSSFSANFIFGNSVNVIKLVSANFVETGRNNNIVQTTRS